MWVGEFCMNLSNIKHFFSTKICRCSEITWCVVSVCFAELLISSDRLGNNSVVLYLSRLFGSFLCSPVVIMLELFIFSAVVGGTVVGLLCTILLIMFIVYRMRKADEGSYALNEPKRSPNVHSYLKAPSREFFAWTFLRMIWKLNSNLKI